MFIFSAWPKDTNVYYRKVSEFQIYLFIYLLKYIYTGLANYIAVFFLGVQLKN